LGVIDDDGRWWRRLVTGGAGLVSVVVDDGGGWERVLCVVDVVQIKHWCLPTLTRLCILLVSILMNINLYKSNE
jgi:hypothetical protein